MSEFIKVKKDGQVIEVHPDALENHKQLGWVVVDEPAAEEKPVEKPEKKAKK